MGYGGETTSGRIWEPKPQREEAMTRTRKPGVSRRATLAMMGAGAVTFATPLVARAQAKTIKVGMPTILSGRVAQLGTSSRNSVMIEVDKVNAARGARELVNTDGCELLIDAEASSGPSRCTRSRAILASSVSIPTRKHRRS